MSSMQTYIVMVILAVLAIWFIRTVPVSQDKVVFLDVGQGAATLLQSGTGQILVDGGPGRAVLPRLAEEMPWFDRTIEVLVVSHSQQDHMEGLLHVLEIYKVKLVIFPRVATGSDLEEAWLALLKQKKIPYRFAWQGEELVMDKVRLRIIAPQPKQNAKISTSDDVNNMSAIVRADFNGMSFLLTGDAEAATERALVASEPRDLLNVDVLDVGHHGSKTSTSAEFLAATTPAVAVISVGANNQYGHPNQAVLDRLSGIPIYRTDKSGSIRFTWLGNRWFMQTQAI